MKILGVICSPRRGANTEILVNEALASAEGLGAEVEALAIASKSIKACDNCDSCLKTGECRIKDDMQEVYTKLLAADGIIFGSPVYFWNVTAQAKALIDRTYAIWRQQRLKNKVAGAIVVAHRAGCTEALSALHSFFTLHGMVPAGAAIAYSFEEEVDGVLIDKKDAVRNDKRGIAEARALGRRIVKAVQGRR